MKASILNHGCLLAILLAAVQTGCGSKETAQTPARGTPATSVGENANEASESEAVVSHFLDRIRRGGEDHNAMELLTTTAQSELRRIGQVVQPIGSPDAKFEVTRSTPMPTDESLGENNVNGRLVHCLWSEPAMRNADGQTVSAPQTYQVVWSVMRQKDGWKISGLVLEMSAEEPPMVLDFENGNQMAMILGGQPVEQTATSPAASEGDPVR